jgi:hypothetical protein
MTLAQIQKGYYGLDIFLILLKNLVIESMKSWFAE